MKTLTNIVISIVVALWVIGIAIISVQNAESISLRFLTFRSIQIPFGLVLSFCAAVGIVGMALLNPLWGLAASEQRDRETENDNEFFIDEEY
ncbi:MAG: DUF1049 domain-containing protein [Scytonema sp. PMC 1069.18]|nr:DUF1049 domain-containing protein [Scytonema sp. PMC 1069.18]MEC4881693.1 DUF1049 domain-containing protein [Scytonema sp. PMC 1070.18]